MSVPDSGERHNQPSNIGPNEQRKRLIVGVLAFVLAAALVFWFEWAGWSRWWRVATFPFLLLGALGLLQAHAHTCVALASRGTCNFDGGVRPVSDPREAARLADSAGTIIQRAVIVALALTLLVVAVP